MSGGKSLDARLVTLDGTHLIEASAGTGKTWTITSLYLRLILERDIKVSNLLVMTYTNAATRELRSRIRQTLETARHCLSNGSTEAISQLTAQTIDSEQFLYRARRALLDFDEAAIFTMHGFCQRVLAERSFEAATPFELEVLTDQSALLAEIIDDFWRTRICSAEPLWASYLLSQGAADAKQLQRLLYPLVGRPYLQVVAPAAVATEPNNERSLLAAFEELQQLWQTARQTIAELLHDHPALNRNAYRVASIPRWIEAMNNFLSRARPDFVCFAEFRHFDRFQSTILQSPKSLKKGQHAPEHPFFDACDHYATLHSQQKDIFMARYQRLQSELFDYANHELLARKSEQHLQSYDDLLYRLNLALDQNPLLTDTLRTDYQAVLVDEFQDTDPTQYAILERVFISGGLPTFLVGDPKQAIYSFRGADIYSYLRAKRDVADHHQLDTNWRSSDRLIHAVNVLFGNAEHHNPLYFPEIPFSPATGASNTRLELSGDPNIKAALVCWQIARNEPSKLLSKQNARQQAAQATAGEIARLLTIPAKLGNNPLAASDIAVLVRTHHEAEIIERSLQAAAVPSVRQTQQNVFDSHEALELERLLIAIAEPTREAHVRAALLTELLGYDARELAELAKDATRWAERLDDFFSYRTLWDEHGFARMFSRLVQGEGIQQRLLAYVDGERRTTNLLHLGELLQAEAPLRAGIQASIKWLAQRRGDSAANEEWLLRLESDAERVRIVTIHASKGLEYPVVFCPFTFGGESAVRHHGPIVCHDAVADALVLDFALSQDDPAYQQAEQSAFAENLRLLYVAVTRAQSRCYITWGAINEAASAPLAWLLHHEEGDTDINACAARVRSLTDEQIATALWRMAAKSSGAFAMCSPPQTAKRYQSSASVPCAGIARVFKRRLPTARLLHSFTALTRGHETDHPDHDALVQRRPQREGDALVFPRGPRAGTCLHRILEKLDFTESIDGAQREMLDSELRCAGFGERWRDSAVMLLDNTLDTAIDGDALRLRTITRKQRCDELEFYTPLAPLSANALSTLLRQHRFGSGAPAQEWIKALNFEQAHGYLHGFIDLIFEYRGRYFLADYKSNDLGFDDAAYTPCQLEITMARESYFLQYLIYALALHRHLQLRVPGYDYGQHFGGVYYLFLRGMEPASSNRRGVYFDRPAQRLIADLDHLVSGE